MIKKSIKFVIITVIILTILTASSLATFRSSDYIIRTDAYISPGYQSGQIFIEYSITGTGTMSKIGASVIHLYKADGSFVQSYSYLTTPSMMGYTTDYHDGYVVYNNASPNEHYYAVVTLIAKNSNGSDSCDQYTPIY